MVDSFHPSRLTVNLHFMFGLSELEPEEREKFEGLYFFC